MNESVTLPLVSNVEDSAVAQAMGTSRVRISQWFDGFDVSKDIDATPFYLNERDRLLWLLDRDEDIRVPPLGAAMIRRTDDGFVDATTGGGGTTLSNAEIDRTWTGHRVNVYDPATPASDWQTVTITQAQEGQATVSPALLRVGSTETDTMPNGVTLKLQRPPGLDHSLYFCIERVAEPFGNGVKVLLTYENVVLNDKPGWAVQTFPSRNSFSGKSEFDGDFNGWYRPNTVRWRTPGGRDLHNIGVETNIEIPLATRQISVYFNSVDAAREKADELIGHVNDNPFLGDPGGFWRCQTAHVVQIGDTHRCVVVFVFLRSPRNEPWFPWLYFTNEKGEVPFGMLTLAEPVWTQQRMDNQDDGTPLREEAPGGLDNVEGWRDNGRQRLKTAPTANFTSLLSDMTYTDPENVPYLDEAGMNTEVVS